MFAFFGIDVGQWLGGFFVPGMIVLIAVAFILVIRVVASRYKKIPPNYVGIFFGRRYKGPDGQVRGFRIVAGGGSLLIPIVEDLQLMSTAAFQVPVDETDIPNRDNVKINMRGMATCKISTAPEDIYSAAGAFLSKTKKEIAEFVGNILKGHLRSIIGKLDIDEVLRKRDEFNRMVVEESTEELKRLGIQIITLVIQEVNDVHGYIDALGRRAISETIRDANIKVAEAESETAKKTSDAKKQAAITVAANEVAVAEAEKNRDVQKANFKVMADTERAKADQAHAIATALQEQVLRVAQAGRDAAEREAQIKVQQNEALRREQELSATVVKQAEAARQKAVIDADAAKQVAVLAAEAESQKSIRIAEGFKQARSLEGEGEASKTRSTLLAIAEGEAEKTRRALLAEAEGEAEKKRRSLLAEAEGQAAMKGKVLTAEAEGTQKLAEALAKMTRDAKLILVLDRLPNLADHLGDAGSKIAASIFSSVAAPLGSVDQIKIVDVGGDGRGLDQFSTLVPRIVFDTIAKFSAMGINAEGILKKLGLDITEAMKTVGEPGQPGPGGPTPPEQGQ